jgi:hypothetical protein
MAKRLNCKNDEGQWQLREIQYQLDSALAALTIAEMRVKYYRKELHEYWNPPDS